MASLRTSRVGGEMGHAKNLPRWRRVCKRRTISGNDWKPTPGAPNSNEKEKERVTRTQRPRAGRCGPLTGIPVRGRPLRMFFIQG